MHQRTSWTRCQITRFSSWSTKLASRCPQRNLSCSRRTCSRSNATSPNSSPPKWTRLQPMLSLVIFAIGRTASTLKSAWRRTTFWRLRTLWRNSCRSEFLTKFRRLLARSTRFKKMMVAEVLISTRSRCNVCSRSMREHNIRSSQKLSSKIAVFQT